MLCLTVTNSTQRPNLEIQHRKGALQAMSGMIGFSTARRYVTALNRIHPNFRSRVNSNTTRSPGYLNTHLPRNHTSTATSNTGRRTEPTPTSAPAPIRSTAGINFVLVLVYVQASQFVKIYRMAENRRKKKDKGNNGRPRSRSRSWDGIKECKSGRRRIWVHSAACR